MFQRGTESCLERSEPRFVIFPSIDAVPIDGAAYLFRARGPNRALVLMVREARLIERHTDEIQHAPDLAFGVLDQLFVDDPVHGARLPLLEMRHEPPVIAVEGPDRFLAVGEQ